MFCDVSGGAARSIFRDFNMAGCVEMETYSKQTTIARQTDSEDTDIVGAVLESGAAAECNDYSHIVQPYRFEPYGKVSKAHRLSVKGNMNNPRLVSTLYRVYVPTSICTKSKKSKKSIDLVIPHYIAPYSLEANIHIQSKQRQQMTWIKSRGSRDKTRSNTAVAIFQSSLILLICLDVEINVLDMVYCVAFGCNAIIYRKG